MNEQTLQILIQGGAVAINLVMLIIFYKIAVLFNQTIRDSNMDGNESKEKQASAYTELSKALQGLTDTIRGCPHNKYNQ